jgi:hypothetical protein
MFGNILNAASLRGVRVLNFRNMAGLRPNRGGRLRLGCVSYFSDQSSNTLTAQTPNLSAGPVKVYADQEKLRDETRRFLISV